MQEKVLNFFLKPCSIELSSKVLQSVGPECGGTDGVSDFECYSFISLHYKYVMPLNVASHHVNKQMIAKFVIGKEGGYNL